MTARNIKETRRRGLFGELIKALFITFNIIMLMWLIAYWIKVGPMMFNGEFSTVIVTAIMFTFWVIGAGILGALTLATRGKKIPIENISES
ncbi:hypothetical protein SAMN05443249_1950 [Beijerinckia sp. 28-YEA-48]|nr:hypothetical protein SAMN05443249_1950 [Beijerinckia sp. 28-YEA-48]